MLDAAIAQPGWDLRPFVYADRKTARPGDAIVYTVIVLNASRADFRGNLHRAAHTPFGTTFEDFEPSPCEGEVSPGCVNVPQPMPGPPTEEVHIPSDTSKPTISAGQELIMRYRVRVNPGVQPGTRLSNHAHATTTDPPRSSTSGTVVVVVE